MKSEQSTSASITSHTHRPPQGASADASLFWDCFSHLTNDNLTQQAKKVTVTAKPILQSLFGGCFGEFFLIWGRFSFLIFIWPSACCWIVFLMNSLSDRVYFGICFSCFQVPSSSDKVVGSTEQNRKIWQQKNHSRSYSRRQFCFMQFAKSFQLNHCDINFKMFSTRQTPA